MTGRRGAACGVRVVFANKRETYSPGLALEGRRPTDRRARLGLCRSSVITSLECAAANQPTQRRRVLSRGHMCKQSDGFHSLTRRREIAHIPSLESDSQFSFLNKSLTACAPPQSVLSSSYQDAQRWPPSLAWPTGVQGLGDGDVGARGQGHGGSPADVARAHATAEPRRCGCFQRRVPVAQRAARQGLRDDLRQGRAGED